MGLRNREHNALVINQINSVLDQYTKNEIDPETVMAAVMTRFDMEDQRQVRQLYLEWMIDAFVRMKLSKCLGIVDKMAKELKKRDHYEDSPFEYNDLDNHIFLAESCRPVVALTSQNFNFLCVPDADLVHRKQLHIWRWWDQAWDQDGCPNYLIDFEEIDEDPAIHMLTHASHLSDYYSDHVKGNEFVRRPDLDWYRDRKFDPERVGHNPTRGGHIVTYFQEFQSEGGKGCIFKYCDISAAVREIVWGYEALHEEYGCFNG
jgi:hypothetical protein